MKRHPAHPEGPLPHLTPPGLRVLIIEDNADNASTLAVMLGLSGHEVRVAADGPTGLRLAATEPPDVVILDIRMPGMNGWQVAARLREQQGQPRLFLIALSGYGQEEDRHRSEEAGIDVHLLKPADPQRLEGLLRGLSGSRGANGHQAVS